MSSASVSLHESAIIVDGMAFRFGGWTDELTLSGVSAIIVTVDDFVSGYASTLARFHAVREIIDRDSRFRLITTIDDIQRAKNDNSVGVILAFQNANPIEDDLAHLATFYELGLRSMQLTYNHVNAVGSGCLAARDDGLSAYGRRVVRAMNEMGVLVDLSHCGPATALDAIALSVSPPAFTHASAAAVTTNPRNRSDTEIRAIADAGGLIGLSAYGPFCWDPVAAARPTLSRLMMHVNHVCALVGDQHVGFGGDWPIGLSPDVYANAKHELARDGARIIGEYNHHVGDATHLRYPADMPSLAALPALTSRLLDSGYSADAVRGMIGGNFVRVLGDAWTQR